jgi:Zn-dependent protease
MRSALLKSASARSTRTERLLADPASIALPASFERLSDEQAGAAGRASMARALGIEDPLRGGAADPVLAAETSGGSPARQGLSAYRQAADPRGRVPSIDIPRLLAGAALLAAIQRGTRYLLAGLPLGPKVLWFDAFSGTLLFWIVLQSLTLHELGHAWVAEKVGDVTPRMAGQMSASPLPFTSPLGASLLLASSLFGFPFGFFATNVQGAFGEKKNKGAMAKLAIAGPLVNLAIGSALTGLLLGAKAFAPSWVLIPCVGGTLRLLVDGILINFCLGIVNLIPLGPLDGQKVLRAAVPDKWIRWFDKITVPLGLALLLGYLAWGLGGSLFTAVTQNGAGTPLAYTHNAFIMSLVANGVLVWLLAVAPTILPLLRKARKLLSDRKVLKAGGLLVLLTLPVVKGKMPIGGKSRLRVAIPWSGTPQGKAPWEGGSFILAEEGASPASAVDLANGSLVAVGPEVRSDLASGRRLLLRKEVSGEYALLPAGALGGEAKALETMETASVSRILGSLDYGRGLLGRRETRVLIELSRRLKAPAYELEFRPDPAHTSIARFARTGQGPAFFVQTSVLRAVAAASPEARPGMIDQLTIYLFSLKHAAEAGLPGRGLDSALPETMPWAASALPAA